MRKIATAAMLLLSVALHGQSSSEIKNIDYYNSLKWKNSASLEVYINNTYSLTKEPSKIIKNRSTRAVVPYRACYPYSYPYSSSYLIGNFGYPNVFYTNGFNMGYNAVYYVPIRLGHRRHRHHRN